MNMEKEMTSPNLTYLCYPSQFWHGAAEALCAVWVKSIYLLVLRSPPFAHSQRSSTKNPDKS